ncbi:hypothetical protein PFDG_05299, partial [Plasmodium falciparum Dd2]
MTQTHENVYDDEEYIDTAKDKNLCHTESKNYYDKHTICVRNMEEDNVLRYAQDNPIRNLK